MRHKWQINEAELKAQNRARRAVGLPCLEILERRCLKCGVKFTSTGNRICPDCAIDNMVPTLSGTDLIYEDGYISNLKGKFV